jgi:hypothetical protein
MTVWGGTNTAQGADCHLLLRYNVKRYGIAKRKSTLYCIPFAVLSRLRLLFMK